MPPRLVDGQWGASFYAPGATPPRPIDERTRKRLLQLRIPARPVFYPSLLLCQHAASRLVVTMLAATFFHGVTLFHIMIKTMIKICKGMTMIWHLCTCVVSRLPTI